MRVMRFSDGLRGGFQWAVTVFSKYILEGVLICVAKKSLKESQKE